MSGRLILVRHGQSLANVERRLDTRPPGAELTEQGRLQARDFARARAVPPGLLLHSIAHRAAQTAAEIGAELSTAPVEVDGIHEVQAGELEDRTDDDAIAAFNTVYQRWQEGDLDAAMPGGERACFYLRGINSEGLPVRQPLGGGVLTEEVPFGDVLALLRDHPEGAAIAVETSGMRCE